MSTTQGSDHRPNEAYRGVQHEEGLEEGELPARVDSMNELAGNGEEMMKHILRQWTNERLGRTNDQRRPHVVGGDDQLLELDWLGGLRGLEKVWKCRADLAVPIEKADTGIRLPKDTVIIDKTRDAEQELTAPRKLRSLETLRRPFPALEPLGPHGPNSDWERWFRNFELQAFLENIPGEQWIETLPYQVTQEVRGGLFKIIRSVRQRGELPPKLLYERVRDRMLDGRGTRYAAWTYYKQIHETEIGYRDAAELAEYLEELCCCYEAARKREVMKLRRLPEISWYHLALLYYDKLPYAIQKHVLPPDEMPLDFTRATFHVLVARATRVERQESSRKSSAPPVTTPAADEWKPQSGGSRRSSKRDSSKQHEGGSEVKSESSKRHRGGRACYFCNGSDHILHCCEQWKAWVEEKPNRIMLCAKCLKGAHPVQLCKQQRGVYWDRPFIPKRSAMTHATSNQECESGRVSEESSPSRGAMARHNGVAGAQRQPSPSPNQQLSDPYGAAVWDVIREPEQRHERSTATFTSFNNEDRSCTCTEGACRGQPLDPCDCTELGCGTCSVSTEATRSSRCLAGSNLDDITSTEEGNYASEAPINKAEMDPGVRNRYTAGDQGELVDSFRSSGDVVPTNAFVAKSEP